MYLYGRRIRESGLVPSENGDSNLSGLAASVLATDPRTSRQCRADERRIRQIIEPAPHELVSIPPRYLADPSRPKQLHRAAHDAYLRMKAAAEADGIAAHLLTITSGYRSVAHQRRLWAEALNRYGSPQAAHRWVAPPGGSPHHTGRAIDLWLGSRNSSANTPALRATVAYKWLVCNAGRFGFFPYANEPWHWEFNPDGSAPGSARPQAPPTSTPSPGLRPLAEVPVGRLPGFNPAEEKALRITTTFETGRPIGFGGLTGNFDGQGLSFGLLQWNIGTGSLQPMLGEFARLHAQSFDSVFGPHAAQFRQVLGQSREDQLRFARSINDARNNIIEPWKTYFGRLAQDPLFQQIQLRDARRRMDDAVNYARLLGLRTERALAVMFDNVTQNGSAWLRVKNRHALVQQLRVAREQQLGRGLTEREFLAVIANVVADTVLPRWRENVRRRRMTIVEGRGRVHGRDFDLEREFGLTDQAWEAAATARPAAVPPSTPSLGPRPAAVPEAQLLQEAIGRGLRDVNRLTDLVFHARHPERRGQSIRPTEPALVREWRDIRERLVRPALTPSAPRPAPSWPGAPRRPIVAAPSVRALRENLLRLAIQEWEKWGKGQRRESDPGMQPLLQDYWLTGVGWIPGTPRWWETVPWSAAFISWLMRRAGAGNAFKYSAAHAVYIKAAKDNRLVNNENPFKAYRVNEVRPEVGDLVCKSRAGSGANYENIGPGLATHCDVVVGVQPGELSAIGGNVDDSVGRRPVRIDANGYVNQPGYFAVIKLSEPSR